MKIFFLRIKTNVRSLEWWECALLLVMCAKFALLILWHFGASINDLRFGDIIMDLFYQRELSAEGTPFPHGFTGIFIIPIVRFILSQLISNDYLLFSITALLTRWLPFVVVIVACSIAIMKDKSILVFGCVLLSLLSFGFLVLNGFSQFQMARVLLIFILLVISVDNDFRITNYTIFTIACVLLVQYSFTMGLLIFGLHVIPSVIAVVMVYVVDNRRETIKRLKNSLMRGGLWLSIVGFASALGFILLYVLRGVNTVEVITQETYIHRNPAIHGSTNSMASSLHVVLTSFLHLFGATGGVQMLSFSGIRNMMLIVAAVTLILVFPICLTRKYSTESTNMKRFIILSWTLFAIHAVVAITTNNMPFVQPRYLAVPMMAMVMMSGYYVYKYLLRPKVITRYVWIAILSVFMLFQLHHQYEWATNARYERVRQHMQLKHELNERNLGLGFGCYDRATLATMIFNREPVVLQVAVYGYGYDHGFNYDQLRITPFWYSAYFQPAEYEGGTFLMLTDVQLNDFKANVRLQELLGEPIEIFRDEDTGFTIIVFDYNIYHTFAHRLDLSTVYFETSVPEVTIDSFYTTVGFRVSDMLVSVGKEGALMHGPYLPLPSGHFEISVDVVLMGIQDMSEVLGWGDVSFNSGADVIESREILFDDFEDGLFTLSLEVELDETVSDFEFRVFVNDGVILRLSNPRIVDLSASEAIEQDRE